MEASCEQAFVENRT